MPCFTFERTSKLISDAIHFLHGSLFLRRHSYSSGAGDSTNSFDCVIGYVAPVQISTVLNDTKQTSALKQVAIFCDGSSLGNGQEASRAAAVALLGYKGYWQAFGEFLGKATNQQAEIAAAAVGLERLKQPCHVSVFTDSKYVVETMNGRFRRKTNLAWWERLDRAAKAHKVRWEWTRGHAGHILQEAADNAARRIAAAGRVDKSILEDAELKVGTIEPAELAE
jgi:ribonuclease HI